MRSGCNSSTSTACCGAASVPATAWSVCARTCAIDYAASHIQHMQKALMQMNVQLHHVVTDITGVTGMRIIRAIVSGNQRPEQLAEFRDVRCSASKETIREALTGNYRPEQVFALRH